VDHWGLWLFERAALELLLFSGVGLAIGGLDDLVIDLIWIGRTLWRRATVYSRYSRVDMRSLQQPCEPGRIAVIIGAWDESAVIGAMLRHAIGVFDHHDYHIYVGVYRNDPATIAAVEAVAAEDCRVRMVNSVLPGPTTKAECLNRIWHRLQQDEEESGVRLKAVVLHDAEDVCHWAELRVFDTLIERFDLVQLPVLPLVDQRSRWVSGHYCDEFAEHHSKQLVVREALGAGVPSAGVGCALSRRAIQAFSDASDGNPFDAASLTEDYEIGLRLREIGGRGIFVRLPTGTGNALVAVRAHFPATLDEAVRQKTRWLTGIALAGWDRLGWSGGIAERWMRLRDRRAILSAVVLASAYLALLLYVLVLAARWWSGRSLATPSPGIEALLMFNAGLLLWRLGMRGIMVGRIYGWREGLRSLPRMLVGNVVAIMAARRAVLRYIGLRGSAPLTWDKTRHIFPHSVPAE
jgi:adsorption protein B